MAVKSLSDYAEEQKKRGRKRDSRTIRRTMAAFKAYKWQLGLVFIAIICTTTLGLVTPLTIAAIFDVAIPQHNLKLLIIYSLVLIATPIVAGVISIGQSYLSSLVGQRVIRNFRNQLYYHLQSLPFRFFTSTRTGEIQSRLTNDISGVQGVVTDTSTRILTNISIVVGCIIAMIYISPLLTLFTCIIFPILTFIALKVGDAGHFTQKKTQVSLASLNTLMQETLSVSGILLIKTFGLQTLVKSRFTEENQELADLNIRLQVITSSFMMIVNIILSVLPALIYLIAGWQIVANPHQATISIGGIIAFTLLQTRLGPAVGQILSIQIQVHSALALFDRIFEYLDLPVEIQNTEHPLHIAREDIKGKITFRDVSFTYKNAESSIFQDTTSTNAAHHPMQEREHVTNTATTGTSAVATKIRPSTLQHISFEIQPGQLAALVGPSGAGKTTISYLIPRLYDVDAGAVEIDGHNVKDLAQSTLSKLIGVVTQETFLFHASIRENLLYGHPGATEEELIAATKAAAIHERILEFEDGYDTIVGERGYRLSGGEKQRIVIARALLMDPRVLILDEATSSLDTHSERLVQEALRSLMAHRTTLAIAHRLSTILAADIILVVDKGEIVERGTHQELMARGGLYTQLYEEQFIHE